MLAWLSKPFVSIALKALLVVGLLGGAYGIYHHFVSGIQKTQQVVDQNAQLTQALKDIDDLKKKTDALDSAQADMIVQLNAKNTAVKTKQNTIQNYINSPAAQKSDRPSSDVLKETVRRLSDAS